MTGWLVDLLPLAILGAVLGLDVVCFPQAMISRPLVAATTAGAFVGQPLQGLLIGVVLELIALETLPFGASRYPEWGSAAVVGGALFADSTPSQVGGLTTAVLAALATAWVGGISMVLLREQNARWARARQHLLERGSGRTVIGLQVAGLTADLVRGGLLTFVALALLRPLAQLALSHWGASPPLSRAFVTAVAATVAAAAVWKIFHAMPGARWLFVGGLAAGLLLLAIR
jgi:mannose/fructose/N-acetylgalactosamine-specific phosphotransferase system component IIC